MWRGRRTGLGGGDGWGEVEEVIKDYMISSKDDRILRRKNVDFEMRRKMQYPMIYFTNGNRWTSRQTKEYIYIGRD